MTQLRSPFDAPSGVAHAICRSEPDGVSAIASAAVELPAGDAPRRIQLFPMGAVAGNDGRAWLLRDAAHAADVIKATQRWAGRLKLVVDYDHQAFHAAAGRGNAAPAAGWIDPATLSADADGVWGEVEWTPAAAGRIAAREYRYLSPDFLHARADGALLLIKGTSLINRPAIDALAAVAGAQAQPQETIVDLSKLAQLLGLPADATLAQIEQAVAGMAGGQTALAAAASKLGLAAGASVEAIAAAAVAASKPDPAKYVPIEGFAQVQAEVAAIKAATLAKDADAAIAGAMDAGKLIPALKDWGLDLFKSDRAAWDKWVASAPASAVAGQLPNGEPPKAGGKVTASELAIAASCGLTEAEYLAAKGA